LLRNLSKFITQTGLYRSKQLETTFHQFCEKPLHITFKDHNLLTNDRKRQFDKLYALRHQFKRLHTLTG